ncbi:MAG: DNA-binding response regulator [Chloroflexi bacterium]|nr:MAG: DNA-binding response regulator [Phototrophicales bacterium]RMF77469.1 MAG: DNA-binding response regulator [Chloroflexota bacterium]
MVAVQDESLQILIVEDDDDTAEVVSTLLKKAGYTTQSVDDGESALQQIATMSPDLVLLDLNLPDISGLEILKHVRSKSFLPMIVISGRTQERDKVDALEAGADDYLAKPFSSEELVARVGALLRRVEWTPQPATKLVVRELELDMPRRQATLRNQKLHLTPVEYGLLITLIRNAGQVVTHDELLHAVWGEEYHGDYAVLRVNISRLRHKIEENPRTPTYIVTVPGQGYRIPTEW